MARHFACTACGKCCHGVLPLTVAEALEHAGRFPLAVMFVPIRAKAKSFEIAARLGMMLDKKTALRVMPIAYLPRDASCPALAADGLCSIHDHKPVRCRAMPFFAWRAEAEQVDLLVPRAGWACDTAADAPAVYDGGKILDRTDFAAERAALEEQGAVLRGYGERLLPLAAGLGPALAAIAAKPQGGEVIVGFSTLLRRLPEVDKTAVARAQVAVLAAWADKGDAAYRRNIAGFKAEMERLRG
ncbi:YkgJ family cysteine cluster protein [Magnetospirillum sulfuroxidans]|uniref:YkgJ family cysteine cluster protein n=1 Tax=Magnetospirillum sulfuroxidans TaxID=611300 RepID=A0ABS5IA89_9PROT|nr:YkgJ family cysteine cluster protein [Magnetospirillum sulfuroxidans]MBR9971332.1 YkgJ family cysteine cluster protein [Magnetospirillum sulfuroxidans]